MVLKNVYILTLENDHKYYCNSRNCLMDAMNEHIKRDKPFTIKSVNHYLYVSSTKRKVSFSVEKVPAYDFYKKWLDIYISSIKSNMEESGRSARHDLEHRLKLRYILAIEPIVLKNLTEQQSTSYIDNQVSVAYPIFNSVF